MRNIKWKLHRRQEDSEKLQIQTHVCSTALTQIGGLLQRIRKQTFVPKLQKVSPEDTEGLLHAYTVHTFSENEQVCGASPRPFRGLF